MPHRTLLAVTLSVVLLVALGAPAWAHEGGHRNGCSAIGAISSNAARDDGRAFGQLIADVVTGLEPGGVTEANDAFHKLACP